MRDRGQHEVRSDVAIAPEPIPERVAQQRDAFTATIQPRDTYITTQQMADELNKLYGTEVAYQQVYKWCQQWFGRLPKWRSNPKMGYRIPLNYRYVGRAWFQTSNPQIRKGAEKVLAEDPREWVVVAVSEIGGEVATTATTHYTRLEATARADVVLETYERSGSSKRNKLVVHVLNVGPVKIRQPSRGQQNNG
jgi:hypothetical protein